MANPRKDTRRLIDKYLSGKATPEEVHQLERAYHQAAAKLDPPDAETAGNMEQIGRESWMALMDRIGYQPARHIRLWPRIAAAASIILALSFGGYFLLHKTLPQQTAQNQTHDIAPGSNKAILILANGRKISLTDAKNGNVAQQNGVAVNKTDSGQLVYHGATAEVAYNTVTTPRGGQYRLTLSDGTKIMLDAASSIKYPVSFGKDRQVMITGHVYFDVKHNLNSPFHLMVKGQEIRDIGTEFIVNAYDDEPEVTTTLLAGSISVNKHILIPGQEAIGGENVKIVNADTQEATAWMNGMFRFNNEKLSIIMRQVARWYDVEVAYEDESLKNKSFGAISTRFGNVSELLRTLELTGAVKFKIEGRKITVMNNSTL